MITSIIDKNVEKHMISHGNPILDPGQSHLQFGFSQGCSPMFAALIFTEFLTEPKDNKDLRYITFLDTSKTVDVVDHKGMLNTLHAQGVQDTLWSLFDVTYTDIMSVVKERS